MRKRLLAGLGVLIVAAAAVTAVSLLLYRPAPQSAKRPAPPQTAAVVRTDLATKVTLDGRLEHGRATAFTGRKSGTVTWLPAVGTVVGRGERLYSVDAKPVIVFLGRTPLYRTIGGRAAPGPDIAEVNANLRALGYASAPAGDRYTAGTSAALRKWQKDHGFGQTGELAAGDVAMLPARVRVDSRKAKPGDPAKADLLTLTSTRKLVKASVGSTEAATGLLTPGRTVALSLPHGKRTTGTVAALTSSGGRTGGADGGAGGEQGGRTVTIGIGDQSAVSGMDEGPVGVTVTADSRKGVLAVPVEALVAVQGGGYAVQVVTGRTSTLVGVDTGMFADGLVEVSGRGLAAGLKVVTAS